MSKTCLWSQFAMFGVKTERLWHSSVVLSIGRYFYILRLLLVVSLYLSGGQFVWFASFMVDFWAFRLNMFIMVIELSGVQFGPKSYAWFQNRTNARRKFDLKSQVWFQTNIARHEVQLPLYYIHFEIAPIQDLASSNILLIQYWAGLKLNLCPFFGGKKVRVKKQKLQNLPHDTLCLSFSCNLNGYVKQVLKSDRLSCF